MRKRAVIYHGCVHNSFVSDQLICMGCGDRVKDGAMKRACFFATQAGFKFEAYGDIQDRLHEYYVNEIT